MLFVKFKKLFEKIIKILARITVEPVMLLYSLSFSNISVFVEDLQMRRICEVKLGNDSLTCQDLANYTDLSSEVQQKFSVFAFYDSIIKSAIPLFFVLFIGAWSDKYGRKVPLFIALLGQACMMLGLVISSLFPNWPVEYLLLPTLMDSMGGGNVCFLTAVNAYISDVSSESSRTSRLSWANSIFFLGGPTGTFISRYLYSHGGYVTVFGVSFGLSFIALIYVLCYIEESHGPYASKKNLDVNKPAMEFTMNKNVAQIYGIDVKNTPKNQIRREDITILKMINDFFNPQRIFDSFQSTLQAREGNTRILILLVIFSSLLRKLSRSPYVFAFTKHALSWKASDYTLWVTFKNLMSTVGSLILVPFLSGRMHVSDHFLGIIGALSSFAEYFLYGIVVFIGQTFFWIAPVCGLLVNSCTIAQRSMLSKYVTSEELGKVSAVLGALDGVMPMITSALYTAIFSQTVSTFPAAHFFLGAAASVLMTIIFLVIKLLEKTKQYDLQKATIPYCKEDTLDKENPVISHNLIRKNSLLHCSDLIPVNMNILPSNKKLDNEPNSNGNCKLAASLSSKLMYIDEDKFRGYSILQKPSIKLKNYFNDNLSVTNLDLPSESNSTSKTSLSSYDKLEFD